MGIDGRGVRYSQKIGVIPEGDVIDDLSVVVEEAWHGAARVAVKKRFGVLGGKVSDFGCTTDVFFVGGTQGVGFRGDVGWLAALRRVGRNRIGAVLLAYDATGNPLPDRVIRIRVRVPLGRSRRLDTFVSRIWEQRERRRDELSDDVKQALERTEVSLGL